MRLKVDVIRAVPGIVAGRPRAETPATTAGRRDFEPLDFARGPSLSLIVPATDAPRTLDRCLAAVQAAAAAPEEIFVVREPHRSGASLARNIGAAGATGDVLVFLDADIVVHPDAFLRIREAFSAAPALTGIFGSYDDAPDAPGTVSRFRNLLHHHVHQAAAGPVATFWTGLGAVRREAFEAVGGFDERRASIEDIELGMRLAAAGGTLALDPMLQGTHLKRWTLVSMIRTDFAHRGVPWVALLASRRVVPAGMNLGWRHRLSALASLVVLGGLVGRRPRVATAGGLAFLWLGSPFYRLLRRRRGAAEALVGIGLHGVHHLTSVAAVPAGLVVHLLRRP